MGVLRPVVPLVFNVAAAVPATVSVEPGITAPVVIVPVPGIPGTNGSAGATGSQGIQGVKGDAGATGVAFSYIGPTQPDTTGWAVNDFWYDTSTETA